MDEAIRSIGNYDGRMPCGKTGYLLGNSRKDKAQSIKKTLESVQDLLRPEAGELPSASRMYCT